MPTTNIGQWIYNELKLYKPQHEIIWAMAELDKMIQEIEEVLEHNPNQELKDRLLDCYRGFVKYAKKLSSAGF